MWWIIGALAYWYVGILVVETVLRKRGAAYGAIVTRWDGWRRQLVIALLGLLWAPLLVVGGLVR